MGITKDKDTKEMAGTVYEKRCPFCRKMVRTLKEEDFASAMQAHIDDCKIAQTIIGWERQGIKKEMIAILRREDLESKLRKLIKEYGFKEVKDSLETLEEE